MRRPHLQILIHCNTKKYQRLSICIRGEFENYYYFFFFRTNFGGHIPADVPRASNERKFSMHRLLPPYALEFKITVTLKTAVGNVLTRGLIFFSPYASELQAKNGKGKKHCPTNCITANYTHRCTCIPTVYSIHGYCCPVAYDSNRPRFRSPMAAVFVIGTDRALGSTRGTNQRRSNGCRYRDERNKRKL